MRRISLPKPTTVQILTAAVAALVMVVLFLLLRPLGLGQEIALRFLMLRISGQMSINMRERPQYAWVSNVEELKNQNALTKEVYKDAENGDKILVFSDKMVIYRESTDKIVYEGKTPKQLNDERLAALVTSVSAKFKESNLVSADNKESPQISVIVDLVKIKEKDPIFYDKAKAGDLIVIYPQEEKIFIYRANDGLVINSGSLKTVIQPSQAAPTN